MRTAGGHRRLPAGAVGGDGDRLPPAGQRRHRDERAHQRPGRPRLEPGRRLPPDPVHRSRRHEGHSGPLLLRPARRWLHRQPEHARHGRLPAQGQHLRSGLGAVRSTRLERQRRQEPRDRRERVHRRDDLQGEQEGVRQRPDDARLPARADPGRPVGRRARDRLRGPGGHGRRPFPRPGPRQLRCGLERHAVHAVRPAARRRRPAGRLVHGRPPRPRRAGAGERDDERDLRRGLRTRRRGTRLHHPRRPQQQRRPQRHEGPGRRRRTVSSFPASR